MAKLSYLSASETRALLCKYFDKVCERAPPLPVHITFADAAALEMCRPRKVMLMSHGDRRWCLCARRNASCNSPWPSWRCSWTSSRSWCSGWKTPWTARSSTRTDGSRSSKRNTRGACSSCCSSAEVFFLNMFLKKNHANEQKRFERPVLSIVVLLSCAIRKTVDGKCTYIILADRRRLFKVKAKLAEAAQMESVDGNIVQS